jgi:hypothetical protein
VNGRDDREYVISETTSTGGIQRFKAGNHGAQHSFGAMIGYVQEGTAAQWGPRIAGWINALVGRDGWSNEDNLELEDTDASGRVTKLRSRHKRTNCLPDIELLHVWIEMN